MKDRETPLRLVRLWGKIAPDVWEQLDRCAAAKNEGAMTWPDYCDLPISAAATYLQSVHGLTPEEAAAGAAELTACYSWRKNKVVYRFDEDLAEVLAEQAEDVKETDVLPSQLLVHLPYPVIYVKTRILEQCDGFFAWVEFDVNRHAPEFRVQWVLEDFSHSFPQVLHLVPGTIKDCLLDTLNTTNEFVEDDIKQTEVSVGDARVILSALQLILYLLAEDTDVREVHNTTVKRRNRTLAEIVQDKAGEVKEFSAGVRVGAAFRRARTSEHTGTGTGGAKRPHMRRGHWHHYWTGPKEKRELILKWTAPTAIHGGVDENVVVFPVKNSKK